ncbi:hypothetical protein Acid345_3799 [Candidatus Koribacter versatilis Ellin345]|uniref:Methyltransferase type 11 domain-containing protein n=1 Tax=Koribacter versatilis (strain Ellin345) TaxID=204669 RepID=Q1IK01_KORVE|nr:hypothetical protein [Candidatus Koribacter versatilis]ABF42799.1 hypothetical protein Acid345_3799 [Candidatus Koribacter versatilis Ellin345]
MGMMLTSVGWRIRGAARFLLKRKPDGVGVLASPTSHPVIQRVVALSRGSGLRINVGCGLDYHEGFLNIDGSNAIPKVDKVLRVPNEPLDEALGAGVAEFILAQDVVEHVHHWEAVAMLGQIARTLRAGGGAQIRVPDCEYIITSDAYSLEEKLDILYGGQDMSRAHGDMSESRAKHPEFFCHRWGWTMRRMRDHLLEAGFAECAFRREDSNFVAYALKAS